MQIKRVSIQNYRGICYATMEFGQITILSGGNGTGKSSFASAIADVFSGGYDPTAVRDPEAPGAGAITVGPPIDGKNQAKPHIAVIELELVDGSRVKRTINREAKRSTVEAFSSTGERLGGQGWVEENLSEVWSADPLRFLRADPKKRAEVIMDFLNPPLSVAEIAAAFGNQEPWWRMILEEHADSCFEAIDAILKAAEERRRMVNGTASQKQKALSELQSRIPVLNEESRDWQKECDEAQDAVRELENENNSALRAVAEVERQHRDAATNHHSQSRNSAAADMQRKIDAAKAEYERKCYEAKAEYASQCSVSMAEESSAKQEISEKARAEREAIIEAFTPRNEAAHDRLIESRRLLREYNEASGLRVHLEAVRQEYKELTSQSLSYDRAIEALRALKLAKMSEVPIAGLEMRDGIPYYDGLPLDAINTSQQIAVAAQIVAQKRKQVPFMVLDDAEHLDMETRQRLVMALAEQGWQVVVCEVLPEGGELKAVTLGSHP